jgi:cytochrome c-type protein NapC
MNILGVVKQIFRGFRRPSSKWAVGTLVSFGFLAGVIAWAGFGGFTQHTSTLEFCTSCHEMEAFVYPEYQQSVHFKSRSGVRPICSDCHVPKAFLPKMQAKIRATLHEIPGHLTGSINTAEKFEAKREELAKRVWARMEANDSAACRNCHEVDAMSFEDQQLRAAREHEAGFADGDTCIDCHKGIAHTLPASMLEEEEELDFDF